LVTGHWPEIVPNGCFLISYPAAPDTLLPYRTRLINSRFSAIADVADQSGEPVTGQELPCTVSP